MNLRRTLAYGASLPERTLRAAAAAAGGVTKLASDTALPRSVRRTNLFRFFLGNFQRFLIEEVGRVQGAYKGSSGKLARNFLARKTVGDVVEAVGIVALKYSPLWFFALLSGAAHGSRAFLRRVVRELKKDGTLPAKVRIRTPQQLLRALERASLASTVPFDQPPLSFRDLGDLRRRMGREYGGLFRATRKALPRPEDLWRRMKQVRLKAGISFLRMSGTMALAGAKAAGKTSGGLFREKIVESYADSLDTVRKKGFRKFFAAASRPYLRAIGGAWHPETPTTTERLLNGHVLKRRRRPRPASSGPPTAPTS